MNSFEYLEHRCVCSCIKFGDEKAHHVCIKVDTGMRIDGTSVSLHSAGSSPMNKQSSNSRSFIVNGQMFLVFPRAPAVASDAQF